MNHLQIADAIDSVVIQLMNAAADTRKLSVINTTPPTRNVWYHAKKHKDDEVSALVEATKNDIFPVRAMPFMNEGSMVEPFGFSSWAILWDKLESTLEKMRLQIMAVGWVMLDWEAFKEEVDWAKRNLLMLQISSFVLMKFPGIRVGWYRNPGQKLQYRLKLLEALRGVNTVYIQVQTADLDEYLPEVKEIAPDHHVVAYIDSRDKNGKIFTDADIFAKCSEIFTHCPNSQIVLRSGFGSPASETANALTVVRDYLIGVA